MLKVTNTLTGKVEELKPIKEGEISIYSCGPTVYNYVHLGNLRAYLFVDLLKRYLQFKGLQVNHVMNITDVDDKTIKASQKEGKTLQEFTTFYLNSFLEDIEALNIRMADVLPKATDHINEMVGITEALLKKGYAYEANGSIYFKISSFPGYGELAKLEKQQLKVNADSRLNQQDEYEKEEINDFVLWKGWKPEDGEVSWETAVGKGRPGWHIECSAMSMKYFGDTFDIHTGGVDLIFPHHTNEIAQSEAATGKKFVNYWIHNAHLLVDGQKMSKSLGNFYTLRDIVAKGFDPILVRMFLLKAHYRQELNFTLEGLAETKAIAEKFINFMIDLDLVIREKPSDIDIEKVIEGNRKEFTSAMDDDLNVSLAFSSLYAFMGEVNKNLSKLSTGQALLIREYVKEIDTVLGFVEVLYEKYKRKLKRVSKDKEILALMEERSQARKHKQYEKADSLRKVLAGKGILLNDRADEYTLRLKEVI